MRRPFLRADFANNCPDGAFDGCVFTAMSEIEVYGAES